ncbi:hypothetical protein COOONC_07830 [Cooperia oncophora]
MDEDRKAGKVLSGYAGYDELWESDDDGDMQELSELLRDGFISDYKHGTILPHVLPLELQSQFIDLMDKDVKNEILEQEEALKAEIDTDIKEHILEGTDGEEEMEEESPTSKQSRKAARILRSVLMSEGRESELFMLQLPGILKVLSQERPSEDRDGVDGRSLPDSSEKATVEQLSLPAGRSIGKLVITKDGRVILKAGGHTMDVAYTASEGQHQSVVMVETSPQSREGYEMHNGNGRYGDPYGGGSGDRNAVYYMGDVRHHFTASLDWKKLRPVGMESVVMVETSPQSREGYEMHNGNGRYGDPYGGGSGDRNAVYYMGDVRHHFTASLDWKKLRPVGMENTATTSDDMMKSPSKKQKPAELDSIRKELKELQQQRTKQITSALKRWNA